MVEIRIIFNNTILIKQTFLRLFLSKNFSFFVSEESFIC